MTTIARPDNPGTYMELVGESTVRPPASVAQTMALPIIHDWGPLGSEEGAQLLQTFGSFDGGFGNGETAGRAAVQGGFVGPGIPGEPAAGGVLVYRMATSAAKRASVKIKNTAGSPEDALILTAVYAGTRGNSISYIVEADPVDEAKARLRILFANQTQERYSYAKTDVTALAAAINSRSKLVTAEMKVSGKTLATSAGTALTAGNNGETLTPTEWDDALSALEFEDFSIFAPFDLTDEGITATVFSWILTQAEEQRPVTGVFGGAEDEDLATAIGLVEDIRDPHVIRLAGGLFHDDFLDADVSTSQLAPRIAGVLAGRGEESSLTFAPIAGLKQIGTVSIGVDELATAAEAGLTVFRRASRVDADLIIAKGVTTFTDQTDEHRPYELFSDPRIVRVADLFLRRMKTYGDENIVGPTRVTETTKAAVRQQGNKEIKALVARELIQSGTSEADKPFFNTVDDPGENLQDAIVFEFGWKFVRTTNFLIGTGRVR
jgi:hypothetical protein